MSKKVTEQVGLIDKLIGKLERTQAANMKAFADAAIDLSRVREKPRAIGDDPKQDVESQLWNIADALQVIGYAVEASLRMKSKAEAEDSDDDGSKLFGSPGGGSGSSKAGAEKSRTPVLDNFGRDLTKMAEDDKLDPIIGREKK